MDHFINRLLEQNDLIPVIAIVGGLMVGALWIVMGTLQAMIVGTARERTKREMAAYVAEGSIDADKAVAMLNAGKQASDACA